MIFEMLLIAVIAYFITTSTIGIIRQRRQSWELLMSLNDRVTKLEEAKK